MKSWAGPMLWLGLVLVCGLPGASQAAGLTSAKEYQIKAVFLYNFANFITWPGTAFGGPDAPFLICVLGEDPYRQQLDTAVAGETVENRAVQAKRLGNLEESAGCQIMFVSESENGRLREIFAYLARKPVLTVGENPDFIKLGGMVQFFEQYNQVRLRIAPAHLESVDLKASANLLRVAQVVGP